MFYRKLFYSLLVLTQLLLSINLYCLPVTFLQLHNPTTQKTVSIVGEFHDSHAIMPVYSSWESFYSSSEKSFVHMLRRLDQQSMIPTDLCWEVPDNKRILGLLKTAQIGKLDLKKVGMSLINSSIIFSFITYAPCQLTGLKKIRFINSDQLRINVFAYLPENNTSPESLKKIFSTVSMKPLQTSFQDIMHLTHPMLNEQMKKLSQKNKEDGATCMYLWKAIARKMTIFYNQYLSGDENRSIYESFKDIFESTTKKDKYSDDRYAILSDLFDLETTLNILTSDAQHSIIYSGDGHALRLASVLEDSFGYRMVINIYQQIGSKQSIYSDLRGTFNYLPLPKQTWQYLANPQESYRTYSKKLLTIEYPKKIITDFISASQAGDAAQLEKIIQDNPDKELVNILYSYGSMHLTPLHFAAMHKANNIVTFLLSHGANIFANDSQDDTPLHTALGFNNLDIAKKLVEVGSNLKSSDSRGRTPLEMAKKIGNKELIQLMEKKIQEYDKANQLAQLSKSQKSPAPTGKMEQ